MQPASNAAKLKRESEKMRQENTETILIKPKRWNYLQNRYDLTPRERQIAELACRGFRNEDIARELEITAGTAKTHIRNIYRKIHVKSKISMLLRFIAETMD